MLCSDTRPEVYCYVNHHTCFYRTTRVFDLYRHKTVCTFTCQETHSLFSLLQGFGMYIRNIWRQRAGKKGKSDWKHTVDENLCKVDSCETKWFSLSFVNTTTCNTDDVIITAHGLSLLIQKSKVTLVVFFTSMMLTDANNLTSHYSLLSQQHGDYVLKTP